MLDLSRKHDRATELRAIADGRLLLNVRNGVTVSRSMLAKIADELEAERAAHAETKRERDAAKTKSNYWQAEYLNACRDASSFADDLVSAEAQRDEALKALAEAEHGLIFAGADKEIADGDFVPAPTAALRIVRAARRALTGGKKDG